MEFILEMGCVRTLTLRGREVTFRAWEGLSYVRNPAAPKLQVLNLYVPEGCENSPVFFPSAIGGYMEAMPIRPETYPDGSANAAAEALARGYIVASPGARGSLTQVDGKWVGKAPAAIVDLKAAVRYLKTVLPQVGGDPEKIISNGTSAGGALSALLGASGDAPEYAPYLAEAGAAEGSDRIFASSCYCPITNLEHSDMAYEWQYGHLTPDSETSRALARTFPAYVDSLLGMERVDTFVRQKLLESAGTAPVLPPDCGIDVESGIVDLNRYSGFITRMKPPAAFDSPELSTAENLLFGSETEKVRHFTPVFPENRAPEEQVYLMNAMNFLGNSGCARHFRIRHGAADRDTAFSISAMLTLCLLEKGREVDYFLPWGVPHSGDYDLEELFAWMDRICK